jgi:uncharacterized protein (DUF736 family)
MTIGHISKQSFEDKATKKQVSYLEMVIRPPMMESATFTIQHVKPETKRNENEPDYVIWYRAPQKSKYPYPSARVGALWNKIGKESGLEYKGGHIEHPLAPGGKINIAVYVAKPKEGDTLPYSHDVVWSAPKPQSNEGGYSDGGYAAPSYRDIPVTVQNAQGQTTATTTMPQREPMPENNLPEIDINEDEIPF